MKKEDLKNGFMIINGGKADPLPEDLFDVPSKEREEEIIKQMTEELKSVIDDKIKNTLSEQAKKLNKWESNGCDCGQPSCDICHG